MTLTGKIYQTLTDAADEYHGGAFVRIPVWESSDVREVLLIMMVYGLLGLCAHNLELCSLPCDNLQINN